MTQLILNFQNDLEPAGGMMISSSLAGSHNYANHTPQQESDSVKRMRDTSGRKCLEQLERLNHVGSWAKTFTDLLIGQEGWYSTRCKLTWKLKGTKYNRIYCQLYPSTLPIEETGYGLLPTPTMMEDRSKIETWDKRMDNFKEKGMTAFSMPLNIMGMKGLLPTPTTQEPTSECEVNENGRRVTASGDSHSLNLGRLAGMGMLPTPMAADIHHSERVKALKETGAKTIASRNNGSSRPNGLMDYMDFNGMLPTPTAMDSTAATANMKSTQVKEGSMHSVTLSRAMAMGMLPTPCRFDYNSARTEEKWEEDKAKYAEQGVNLQMGLKQMARFEMLPTPATRDWKGARTEEALQESGRNHTNSLPDAFAQTGVTSHLSPQFVLEMMGFPTDWTLLPFLSGETNPSKQGETQ